MTSGKWAWTARNQHQLTEGTFDDREPIFSHDGTHIAFSSDRGDPLGSDNNIWILDVETAQLTELTTNPAEDTMPAWSPDDKEIVFISSRDNYKSAWAVNVATKAERKVAGVATGRLDAASYGPDGQLVYETSDGNDSQLNLDGKAMTKNEVVFPFRPSWVSDKRVLLYRRRQDQAPHLGRRRQGRSFHGLAGSDAREHLCPQEARFQRSGAAPGPGH